MRAVQLKCYYTGKPAPEADRVRIQANIDRMKAELEKLDPKSTLASSYRLSIYTLEGRCRPVRA